MSGPDGLLADALLKAAFRPPAPEKAEPARVGALVLLADNERANILKKQEAEEQLAQFPR